MKKKPIIENEPIQLFFGLSYANYEVIPRSVLQSMPIEWQEKFVELLEQISDVIDEDWEPDGGYQVQARANGRLISDPYSNYERGRRRLTIKVAAQK